MLGLSIPMTENHDFGLCRVNKLFLQNPIKRQGVVVRYLDSQFLTIDVNIEPMSRVDDSRNAGGGGG